jgi:hypothetical protein
VLFYVIFRPRAVICEQWTAKCPTCPHFISSKTMTLRLFCPAIPGDRYRPSTANRTADLLSSGQKHANSQAPSCFKYSYGTCSALDMFLHMIHALWQVNVAAIDRAVSFALYRNIAVNGRWYLLSNCLRSTQSALCLTSVHDNFFEPHWTCETDRIMFSQYCLECRKVSWVSRYCKILCYQEIFGFPFF